MVGCSCRTSPVLFLAGYDLSPIPSIKSPLFTHLAYAYKGRKNAPCASLGYIKIGLFPLAWDGSGKRGW